MKISDNKKKNLYNKIEDMLNNGDNPLSELLIHKPRWYQFLEGFHIKKYLYFLREYYTPSYNFLASIYDFICMIENIYMYPNDEKNHIFAYRSLKPGIRSFVIREKSKYSTNDSNEMYLIEYTLYPDKSINITIRRKWGSNIKTTVSFKDGQDLMLSETDQILFNNIIIITMNAVLDLFENIYNSIQPIELRSISSDKDSFTHF